MDHKKNLERGKELLRKSDILEINKKYILDFIKAGEAGLLKDGEKTSLRRLYKYSTTLRKMSKMLNKDFKKATKKDLQALVGEINHMKKPNGENYTNWTKYTYKVVLKRFYKFLYKGEYPKKVKWIKPRMKKRNEINSEELITIEDAKKLANNTENLRDRAFILFLFETGARIGEIQSIKRKHFKSDIHGAKVTIPKGKTGVRTIRIISSAPAISNWNNIHPCKDPNSPLFCSISNFKKGENIEYQNFWKMLRKTANKANINKPVNPHHFRHSRATILSQKLTEAQLCQYFGWEIGSKEAATYVHLSGRDIDRAILAMHGIVDEKNKEDDMKPIECPRCKTKNDYAAKFCNNCSLGLDEKSIIEYDKQKEEALETINLVGSKKFQDLVHEEVKKQISKLTK